LVSSEIALAVVLLVSAGMLGRTLLRLSALDPGVDVHNVLVTRMALSRRFCTTPRASARPGTKCSTARSACRGRSGQYGRYRPMRQGYNENGYYRPNAPVPPRTSSPWRWPPV